MSSSVPTNVQIPPLSTDPNRTQHSASSDSNIIATNNDQQCNINEDKMTILTMQQSNKLKQDGYCMLGDPLREIQIRYVVQGYIRRNYNYHDFFNELIREIIYYYDSRFNTEKYIELVCNRANPRYFLVPRRNITLCALLSNMDASINKAEMDETKLSDPEILQAVLRYLGHHKGIEPDALPCPLRSIHMTEICADEWDAIFMDAFEKKEVFEIILVAQYLGIQSLLHLGCAKIATLIKQLDQKEINRIIEEDEKYQREHAQNNDNNDAVVGNDVDGNMGNDEVVIERKCTDLIDKNSDEYEQSGCMDGENE